METMLSPEELQELESVMPLLDKTNPVYEDFTVGIKVCAGSPSDAIIGNLLVATAHVIRLVETGLVPEDHMDEDLSRLNSIRDVFRAALTRQNPDHESLRKERAFSASAVGIPMF